MTIHRSSNEFEINIARYRSLAREVTDPLAACLLAVVIRDLEASLLETSLLETGLEEVPQPPSNA